MAAVDILKSGLTSFPKIHERAMADEVCVMLVSLCAALEKKDQRISFTLSVLGLHKLSWL